MFNVDMKRLYKSELRLLSFTVAVTVTILYTVPDQTSWAAIITCPSGATVCNGTSADDIIVGTTAHALIHGLGGNDYIVGIGWGVTTFTETMGMMF